MAQPTVTWSYNSTDADLTSSVFTTIPITDTGSRTILWLGSAPAALSDPTSAQLSAAGILVPLSNYNRHGKCYACPGLIIGEVGVSGTIIEIPLASGTFVGGLSRYVFRINFSCEPVSEPTLEFWADKKAELVNQAILGSGTTFGSLVRGITTTNYSPPTPVGATASLDNLWKRLVGGSSTNNYLLLNDGLSMWSGAKNLYFAIAIEIPSGITQTINESPYMILRYKYQ